jgi:hypothetical protein
VFFGLNLRADTWRVYLGYWVWGACWGGSLYGSQLAALLVGLIAGGIASMSGNAGTAAMVGLTAGVIAFLIAGSALIWAAVRMAPAAANSIEKRRFAFFESWGVTRGLFWPMLGSFALALLPYLIVSLVLQGAMLVVLSAALADLARDTGYDMAEIQAKFSQPEIVATLVVCYLLLTAAMFVFHITSIGINARAIMVHRARRA